MAKIKYEQNLMEKESKQKMETIDDEIHLAKEKSKTDAEFYRVGWLPAYHILDLFYDCRSTNKIY